MPRRPRFICPGLPHHITQRGNNRQDVFLTDEDRRRYLELLGSQLERRQIRVLAWCLMSNHVHLIAIPPASGSFSLAIARAHSEYALDWNRRLQRVGHLWQNRFFSCSLDADHLISAMRYVDLNPVRAGIVPEASRWAWSSAAAHLGLGRADSLLDPDWRRELQEVGMAEWDFEHWRALLGEIQPDGELASIRRATRVSEPLGSGTFIQRMEEASGRKLTVLGRGRPKRPKILVNCV